ncbi:MAG: HAD hydrolase family protein, partial [Myxococcaceae bacterium]|nr:HAD hydrolase family protein [Myxococcaceae bacterium]
MAPAPDIALLLADVDGTLLTSDKQLTSRAERAVHRLRDAGITLAITSGRPPLGMRMFLPRLALTAPVAAFNGGLFVRPDDLSPLASHVLPQAVVPRVMQEMEAHHLDVWLYRGKDWYLRDVEAPHVAREQWTVQFAPTRVDDFRDLLEGVLKVVGVSDDLEAVRACEAKLQSICASRRRPLEASPTTWTSPTPTPTRAPWWSSSRAGSDFRTGASPPSGTSRATCACSRRAACPSPWAMRRRTCRPGRTASRAPATR